MAYAKEIATVVHFMLGCCCWCRLLLALANGATILRVDLGGFTEYLRSTMGHKTRRGDRYGKKAKRAGRRIFCSVRI